MFHTSLKLTAAYALVMVYEYHVRCEECDYRMDCLDAREALLARTRHETVRGHNVFAYQLRKRTSKSNKLKCL